MITIDNAKFLPNMSGETGNLTPINVEEKMIKGVSINFNIKDLTINPIVLIKPNLAN